MRQCYVTNPPDQAVRANVIEHLDSDLHGCISLKLIKLIINSRHQLTRSESIPLSKIIQIQILLMLFFEVSEATKKFSKKTGNFRGASNVFKISRLTLQQQKRDKVVVCFYDGNALFCLKRLTSACFDRFRNFRTKHL